MNEIETTLKDILTNGDLIWMHKTEFVKSKPMPESMNTLRDILTKNEFAWYDDSDSNSISAIWKRYTDDSGLNAYDRIYRTKWKTDKHEYSAICGFGTYGGRKDLLELMVDNNEPYGYLSADEVFEIMAECEINDKLPGQ